MRLAMLALVFLAAAPTALAVDLAAIVRDHITPRYQALATTTALLEQQAKTACAPQNAPLTAAYHRAFDAWVGVSHLRFGPSEAEDRAFALAFWPDPRGATPKTLALLIRNSDPVVADPVAFKTVSVAARGFYALEFLLYDPQFAAPERPGYHCALIQAVTRDIAANAAAILDAWQDGYADLVSRPGNDLYRTEVEAAQQVFTALSTGLEFTSVTRLGRPLGTFARPRPNRAEARRSGRALHHVVLSLTATRELALHLAPGNARLVAAFESSPFHPRDRLRSGDRPCRRWS
ncbi:MAG: imelysin family protein, partial [Pseudomonadota bacterium]